MKIRSVTRKVKTWIAAFLQPKPEFDWLSFDYELVNEPYRKDDEHLDILIAKRSRLKKHKKSCKAVDREIALHRASMLRKGMHL